MPIRSEVETMPPLQAVHDVIALARERFLELLRTRLPATGLTPHIYQRYLSMQYHLTRDVQRYFLTAAAHADLGKMRSLRRFLVDFANEEELHYVVAGNDLLHAGLAVLPMPFDVELWHCYFTKIVTTRPFVRLGAATVLENLSTPATRPLFRQLLGAPFLNRDNTKFLVLHMHETLPHGEQILDALAAARLLDHHLADLAEGARKGAVQYLRMAEWAIDPAAISGLADGPPADLDSRDRERIAAFDMRELEPAGAETTSPPP